MLDFEDLSGRICGAAIAVHRELGLGLLESAYEICLCHELSAWGIGFERPVELPVLYKGIALDCGYRMDLLVEDTIVLELKSIEALLPLHTAQLLAYLRLSHKPLGLLLNFNVPVMKDGVRRVVLKPRG